MQNHLRNPFLAIFIFSLLFVSTSWAQLVHQVESGETLYALSKQYDIPIKSIIDANPNAEYGLKVGMNIHIPSKQQFEEKNSDATEYLEHVIRPFETFYSLKNRYRLDREDILELNPELEQSFRAGDTIKIPMIKGRTKVPKNAKVLVKEFQTSKESSVKIKRKVEEKREDYLVLEEEEETNKRDRGRTLFPSSDAKVSLLLPLYLAQNDEILLNGKKKVYSKSEYALQFLAGAKLALKQWKARGLGVKVGVYDTENNSATISRLASQDFVKNSDMIIGPFYGNRVRYTQNLLPQNPMIAPFTDDDNITENHPNVFQIHPPIKEQMEYLARYASKRYFNTPVVMIGNDSLESNMLKGYLRNALENVNSSSSYYRELTLENGMLKIGRDYFVEDQKYVIFIASEDKGFVSNVISGLHKLRNSQLIVFAHPNIEQNKFVDRDYLVDLNVHFPTIQTMDFEHPRVQKFLSDFRDMHGFEPHPRFAFAGYDLMHFFCKQWDEKGRFKAADIERYDGLSFSIDFEGSSSFFDRKDGYINEYMKIIQIKQDEDAQVYPFLRRL